MDPTRYDHEVFDITTAISRQVFPISLDTDAPAFRAGLDRLLHWSRRIDAAKARGGLVGGIARGWAAMGAAGCFARLYLQPVRRHALPAQMRVAPVW